MSVSVQDLYTRTCDLLAEPNGLVTGVVTQADFLNHARDALADFLQKTGIYKQLFYLRALALTSQYTYADVLMKTLAVFYDRTYLAKTDALSLGAAGWGWQAEVGLPTEWHEDRLPPKTIEAHPAPATSGAVIPGAPIPESAAVDNLLLIGTAKQVLAGLSLSTVIQGIPDSFTPYIGYRILWKIFSSDSECKDLHRAGYCDTRYQEGVSLAKALMGEEQLDG